MQHKRKWFALMLSVCGDYRALQRGYKRGVLGFRGWKIPKTPKKQKIVILQNKAHKSHGVVRRECVHYLESVGARGSVFLCVFFEVFDKHEKLAFFGSAGGEATKKWFVRLVCVQGGRQGV
jgi:hypothetical protein